MRNTRVMISGILLTIMVVGFSGCIISTSPGTGSVIEMSPGETKVFKVNGVALNTSTSKCLWGINRQDGNEPEFLERTDHVEFTVNPEGEKSNRVIIVCALLNYMLVYNSGPQAGDGGWYWDWVPTEYRIWNVRILKNTAPVWQGDYYIEDRTDLNLLNRYTEITGDLYISFTPLENLSGLDNLTAVGGNLLIGRNDALTSLGMTGLRKVGSDFEIFDNPMLCKSLAEELMNQVLTSGGIGGWSYIGGNKECTTP